MPPPTRLQMPLVWPSAPVVAVVLSKGNVPTPEITVGLLQLSGPVAGGAVVMLNTSAPATAPPSGYMPICTV